MDGSIQRRLLTELPVRAGVLATDAALRGARAVATMSE